MKNQRRIPATRIEWTLLMVVYLLILSFTLVNISHGQDAARPAIDTVTTADDTLSLSEQYLYQTAEKRMKNRRLGGGLSIATGFLSLIGGAALASNSNDDDLWQIDKTMGSILMAQGGIAVVSGLVILSIKTPAEKKRLEVQSYVDAGERDRAAEKALQELAEKTRKNRLINSALYGGLTVIALASGDEDFQAIAPLTGMVAFFGAAIPSLEERQLKRYREESARQQPALKLGVGLTPKGGGVLKARIDF